MIVHLLEQLEIVGAEPVVVVVGHGREEVTAALGQWNVKFADVRLPLF